MKKLPLIIILVLLITIGGIRLKINHLTSTKTNQVSEAGQVKSAQTNNTANFKNLKQMPTAPEFKLPPIKKEGAREPYVFMKAGILMDQTTFYPLWQKNASEEVPIASTTKIMTAIISLENYNINDVIEISQKAAAQIGSDSRLKIGETLTVESLLKAALIQSGNDAAYALAEKMGVDNFVAKMNERAESLGLKNTRFKDPAGLDDSGHSTAFDLAVIASYAMRNPHFAEIVKIHETTIHSSDGRFEHKLETSNRLLKNDHPLYLSYVMGIKTGFTPTAGHCLVAMAEQNSHRLISVVLNTIENTVEASAKESNRLLEWGYASYQW